MEKHNSRVEQRNSHMEQHNSQEFHHHHSHSDQSEHKGAHHLLQVEQLSVGFQRYSSSKGKRLQQAAVQWLIEDLSISVHEHEIVAIVGASGSGKTLLADALMGLYAPNAQVQGVMYFDGKRQTPESLAALRGSSIAFVPQSVTALDPLMRVGKQIGGDPQRRAQLFERYGLEPQVEQLYPHELSGGMARRVLLVMALMNNPRLIIADEPTPGLDLERAVVALEDFRSFAQQGSSVLLITHDIELALRVAHRVAVFKDGTIVEETAVERFARPELLRHPFSRALWHALPEHDFALCKEQEGE